MNDLLKKRMSATQQAAEIVVGDEAYETLFRGAPAPEASRFCELPMDKLRPFFTADIGFHPYPPEKLKAFSQQLAEQGIYERVTQRRVTPSVRPKKLTISIRTTWLTSLIQLQKMA